MSDLTPTGSLDDTHGDGSSLPTLKLVQSMLKLAISLQVTHLSVTEACFLLSLIVKVVLLFTLWMQRNGWLSKYDGIDVSSIPTTRGDVVNGGIQVGFGDATDPIESASNSSFASNYDSSEGYTPYIEASSNSGDVISSDTDTFWKGTFAGEVLDLSDYTDKTTGADYSFSSDHIEIGIDGDYFTVTDQSKPDAPVYQPTADDLAGLGIH